MIVLCEIGWPQKSPWVRMIWMISCKETIKINSKTWLRFRLIIKPNISIHVSHTDEYQKMISLTNSRFRCLWCSVFCVNDFCTTELKWYKTKFCGQARSNPWPRWSACPRFWFVLCPSPSKIWRAWVCKWQELGHQFVAEIKSIKIGSHLQFKEPICMKSFRIDTHDSVRLRLGLMCADPRPSVTLLCVSILSQVPHWVEEPPINLNWNCQNCQNSTSGLSENHQKLASLADPNPNQSEGELRIRLEPHYWYRRNW